MKPLILVALVALLLTGVAPAPAAQQPSSRQPAFTIATFNVLGHSHTAPGGKAEQMAEGPERTRLVAKILRQYKIDIVGFQEQQPVQAHAFVRYAGSTYTLYPGVRRPKWVYNAIAWRKATWELVRTRTYDVPYRQRSGGCPWCCCGTAPPARGSGSPTITTRLTPGTSRVSRSGGTAR
ncbi:hypothetical protein [Nocardioides speluncae]|uniref:hypothetical protein n=1 Tax=Nocardioides speluncae TaxID=2670337 RepID=UPI000D68B5AD|nr:hypothetical protein [Nocardioides speluncae]